MAELRIGDRVFRTKGEALEAVQALRDRYSVGERVNRPEDDAFLRGLLDLHDFAADKIGCGVDHFIIDAPYLGKSSGFRIIRTDGSDVDFSFRQIIYPKKARTEVLGALRAEINDITSGYFDSRRQEGNLTSDMSGDAVDPEHCRVSHHFRGPRFVEIAAEFVGPEGNWEAVAITSSDEEGVALLADPEVRQRWREHYSGRKVLALLTEDEHKQLGSGHKTPGQ
ncbi:DCL family protein [Streptacidiphilus sp. MAP5-3]|uniref:DCL family protein n=1 Tax=unclassified Streptacidiphilus TaxID=2643834 RepID=UPI0035195CA3